MQWTNGDVWVLETRIREGTHTFKVRAVWGGGVPFMGLVGGSRWHHTVWRCTWHLGK